MLISYNSFGKSHQVLILNQCLKTLTRDNLASPVPVMEERYKGNTSREFVKIGYAAWTASGKALKISTTTSGGDLFVPLINFLRVVSHKERAAPISRIGGSQEQPRSATTNIREGLVTGF